MSKSAVEMTEQEINDEVRKMFSRSKLITENSYEVSCRQCDRLIILDKSQYSHYENNKANGHGFTQPKCSQC